MLDFLFDLGKGLFSGLFNFAKKTTKEYAIRSETDKDGITTNTFIYSRDECTPWEKKIWDQDYGTKGKE